MALGVVTGRADRPRLRTRRWAVILGIRIQTPSRAWRVLLRGGIVITGFTFRWCGGREDDVSVLSIWGCCFEGCVDAAVDTLGDESLLEVSSIGGVNAAGLVVRGIFVVVVHGEGGLDEAGVAA